MNLPDPAADVVPDPTGRRRPRRVLHAADSEEVLATVPFLLGMHPTDSIVLLGLRDPTGPTELRLLSRFDIPPPTEPLGDLAGIARHQLGVLASRGVRSIVVLAYSGDQYAAWRLVRAVLRVFGGAGITTHSVISTDGRLWWRSFDGRRPDVASGRAYDLSSHPATVEAVLRGEVAYVDEAELRASLEAPPGLARLSMLRTTRRVVTELADRYFAAPSRDRPDTGGPFGSFVGAGRDAVTDLVRGWLRERSCLDDERVARIAFFLAHPYVRDRAVELFTRERADDHVDLWCEVGRRAIPPGHVAPMTLLAFAAWQADRAPLARCALDRAVQGDPAYRFARLLRSALDQGIDPLRWEGPDHRACRTCDDGDRCDACDDGAETRRRAHRAERPER